MTKRMILFFIIFILNLFIAIIYLLWNTIRQKEKNRSTWMKAFVMLVCPGIGPFFFFLSFLLYKCFSQAMDLEDVIFNKEKVETFRHPDEEMERNMVSLEEALVITDKSNLRNLMMNVIRGDYRNMLSSISKALDSEDSETAHYAASVLQDVLNEFRVTAQNRYTEACTEAENQTELCTELIEYLNPVLEQRILTNLEQRSMVELMDKTGQILYDRNKDQISSEAYEMISLRLLELKDYERCKIWCDRAREQYPNSLASYTCQLKLYFSSGNREAFLHVMQELKQSDIMIDHETLELIRTFM